LPPAARRDLATKLVQLVVDRIFGRLGFGSDWAEGPPDIH